jgi:hypothetical protein
MIWIRNCQVYASCSILNCSAEHHALLRNIHTETCMEIYNTSSAISNEDRNSMDDQVKNLKSPLKGHTMESLYPC